MKKITLLCILSFCLSTSEAYATELTQVIRGIVVDAATQNPLPQATITISTLNPIMGTTTDIDGNFRLENVPLGRHNLQVSYMGYNLKMISELMVTSSKEIVLRIQMIEKISSLKMAVIVGQVKKDKPINTMSTVSARTFSVEEAQRYAGGFDDPARLASSFAGVSTGYIDDNGIIVRGNAPKGLLWRLEGVEIPNPNHFANMSTFGGGGVSALSSLMLANSDFFTGAFPAEYGNAMSGVFDINLRTGNNETYEHAFQAGALGIDISSEGPFSKKSNASYLFNYRYSTFGLIKFVLPEEANVPNYQDFSFKVNLPTKRAGTFALWALAADDKITFDPEMDTTMWTYNSDRDIGFANQRMGVVGLNHRQVFGTNTYLKSSISVSGSATEYHRGVLGFNLDDFDSEKINVMDYKYTFSSLMNHKFGSRHTNRTGVVVNSKHYDNLIQYAPSLGQNLITGVDDQGSLNYYQFFSQSRINFTEKLKSNIGIHTQYFDMNKEFVVEPRIGVTYDINKRHSLSLAYGKHSRLEPQSLYQSKVMLGGINTTPNKDLRVSKSHHIVLAYDVSLRPQLRLKIEPYVQFLYDIPVIPDSSYSAINMQADWFFSDAMTNEGTGTNIGIDVTLERFLVDGYYYLITASLYDSKYIGGDNIERSTQFNGSYVFNVLLGKEWTLGSEKNKVLGLNARLNMMGGQRLTPVNMDMSLNSQSVVYDYSQLYSEQKPNVYHLNATISYRINKKKHSGIWSLQVMNALGTKEHYGYAYNLRTQKIDEEKISVVVPSISYKIEF